MFSVRLVCASILAWALALPPIAAVTYPETFLYDWGLGICGAVREDQFESAKCKSYGVSGERYVWGGIQTFHQSMKYANKKLDQIDAAFVGIDDKLGCKEALKSFLCQHVAPPCMTATVKSEDPYSLPSKDDAKSSDNGKSRKHNDDSSDVPDKGGPGDGPDKDGPGDGPDKDGPGDGSEKDVPGADPDKGGPGDGPDKDGPGDGSEKDVPGDGPDKDGPGEGPGKDKSCTLQCMQNAKPQYPECANFEERCPNSVLIDCDCSITEIKMPKRPCVGICHTIQSRCASVKSKIPPSLLPNCNATYPDPAKVNTTGSPGILPGLDIWVGKPIFQAAEEESFTLYVNGEPKVPMEMAQCDEPVIIERECNTTRLEDMCPPPFVSKMNETLCTAECTFPCPSPLYYFNVNKWGTQIAPFVAVGAVALFFNSVLFASEVSAVVKGQTGNWIILTSATMGLLYILTGVAPAALNGYDVHCDGSDYEVPYNEEVDTTLGCTFSKYSVFFLHSFIFASGCSVASFYYTLYSSMAFSEQPRHQHKIYAAIIFLLPCILAAISNAYEFDWTEQELVDEKGGSKMGMKDRLLLGVHLDVRSKMNAIRSAFACTPDLESSSEIIILQLPMILGLGITLFYSIRTEKMLNAAALHTSRTASQNADNVFRLQRKAAKAMHRFAVLAAFFIVARTVCMAVFYPQLEVFSDDLFDFYLCFAFESFRKSSYKHLSECMREKGIYSMYQCVEIAMATCESPLESGDVPTLFFYRFLTVGTAALPALFGLLMSWKVLKEGCCKKKRVVPRSTQVSTAAASSSGERSTINGTSDVSVANT